MKVLLVDDHALIREALQALLLDMEPRAQILVAADADSTQDLVAAHADADLMLLDLALPGASGTSLLEAVVRRAPRLKILVLTALHDRQSVERTLRLGAAGYVAKSMGSDNLMWAIRLVLSGGVYIPVDLLKKPTYESSYEVSYEDSHEGSPAREIREPVEARGGLTGRQEQVLQWLANGSQLKVISREMEISYGTVKAHVRAIYRAFGASNRTGALIGARQRGYNIGR